MQEANSPDDEPVGPVSGDDWRVTLEPGNGSGHPSWRWAAHRRTEQGWTVDGEGGGFSDRKAADAAATSHIAARLAIEHALRRKQRRETGEH